MNEDKRWLRAQRAAIRNRGAVQGPFNRQARRAIARMKIPCEKCDRIIRSDKMMDHYMKYHIEEFGDIQ